MQNLSEGGFEILMAFPLTHILFAIAMISSAAILLLSLRAAFSDNFQFWPPPDKGSWQHKCFLWLFRGLLYPLIALSFMEIERPDNIFDLIKCGVGGSLLVVGFGFALRITFVMGWRNAFGEKLGLKTSGYFARSRNPIYVATWIGLIGWAILVSSTLVSILLGIWALFYLIAPYFEEPWLERMYGDEFQEYRNQVPRFL